MFGRLGAYAIDGCLGFLCKQQELQSSTAWNGSMRVRMQARRTVLLDLEMISIGHQAASLAHHAMAGPLESGCDFANLSRLVRKACACATVLSV